MKKYLMIFCMMFIASAAFAQQGATWIGAQANYGLHKDYKNIGVGAKVQYEFIDNVRAEASGNYFFKKDYASYWNVEANVEYLFHVGDSFTVYPLVGLDLLGQRYDDGSFSNTDTKLGLNLGVGVEYPIASMLSLKAEFNYKTEANGYSLLKAGIVIPF
jgi:opacity protein-like surface antigen